MSCNPTGIEYCNWHQLAAEFVLLVEKLKEENSPHLDRLLPLWNALHLEEAMSYGKKMDDMQKSIHSLGRSVNNLILFVLQDQYPDVASSFGLTGAPVTNVLGAAMDFAQIERQTACNSGRKRASRAKRKKKTECPLQEAHVEPTEEGESSPSVLPPEQPTLDETEVQVVDPFATCD